MPSASFPAGVARPACGRLKIQERSRPDGRPREAQGGAASPRATASGPAVATRVSSPTDPRVRRKPDLIGCSIPMPTDKDLFQEEQQMVTMSFGDHIEELRVRLILGLLGLMVGVVVTFIPPLNLGKQIMTKMEEPARGALRKFYGGRPHPRAREAEKTKATPPPTQAITPAETFFAELGRLAPQLDLPRPDQ